MHTRHLFTYILSYHIAVTYISQDDSGVPLDKREIEARYQEFVYNKVFAPMSQIVITHTKRDYRIEHKNNTN